MMTIILFLLSIASASTQKVFNPSEFDYCSVKCGLEAHTACDCAVVAPREEVLDDIVSFRQQVLNLHNQWRNHVASGKAAETSPLVPSASDMLGLNYDLELEYIARCHARKFNGNHDKCRNTHENVYVGQNLAGISIKNYSVVPGLIKSLYDEIEYIEDQSNIDVFQTSQTSKGVIGHFTQLVWSETDRLGCARVWNPQMVPEAWKFTLICNYGSSKGSAGNLAGTPVFKKGEPCSGCPFGTKCEDAQFTSLCGKISPAPTDPPSQFASAGGKREERVLVLSLVVFAFLYSHSQFVWKI